MRSKQTKPENLNERANFPSMESADNSGKLKCYLIHFHPPSISIGKHFILGDTCRLHFGRYTRNLRNLEQTFPSAARLYKKCPISRRYPVDWTRMAEYSYMTHVLFQRCTAEIFLRPRITVARLASVDRVCTK